LFPRSGFAATGEITPAYSILASEDVARIHHINPRLKIIFMLRNPIDRAWSEVRFQVENGRLLDSERASIDHVARPTQTLRSDYERTLEVYLEHFSTRQILVGYYDAISADPMGLLESVFAFLGVNAPSLPKDALDRRINASPPRKMPPAVRDQLIQRYEPAMQRLSDRFGGYCSLWLHELRREQGRQTGPAPEGPFPATTSP